MFGVTQTVGSQGRAVIVRTHLVAEGGPDVGTRNMCISNLPSICIAFLFSWVTGVGNDGDGDD